MNRIMIIGSPGSGKSTFARQLSAMVHIDVVHLDALQSDAVQQATGNQDLLGS